MRSKAKGKSQRSKEEIKKFQETVTKYWEECGRHALPWRKTRDPYKILVSEVMLQQTQVDRVLPYYKRFLQKFPNARALAKAELSEVLKIWSGLGYNRRAKYLYDAAKAIVERYAGKFPKSYDALLKLPGVGDYTARAVRVFAFNEPDVLLETNIRTAFMHHFSSTHKSGLWVDKDIAMLATEGAEGQDPREWHSALMDYGAYLKKSGVRLNSKSLLYVKQSKFEGSLRQLRGKLLRRLMDGPITKASFKKIDAKNAYDISMALQGMEREGLVVKEKGRWRIS